jgi:2,3-dihydroxy-p-cumate/2,3-dihydroxybenzoate 3,4-dioxygenase
MVELEQLRYVRLRPSDLAQAADFATRVLGLEPVDRTPETATFRSDYRDYTLAFGQDRVPSVGLEVRYSSDLDAAQKALGGLGLQTGRGSAEDCALRKVKDMVWFADFSGNRFELVVRPLNTGWRYFPSRDAGIRGLADVMIRSTNVEKDLSIWTGVFNNAKVRDWAGDAAYLGFDDAHHRLAFFPAERPGILAVEYAVEDVNLLMRNHYALRDFQVPVVHGPGRRPASDQLFLTFAGPADVLFSFVAEGANISPTHRARQFPSGPEGLCGWGSDCRVNEFNALAKGRGR